jgi:hypothetical protein
VPTSLQAVLLLCAGYALWRLWRLTDLIHPLLRHLIAGGFLVRAFAGQTLFWISYLDLPFGRSLQIGHGLWFFGLDGVKYLRTAGTAAHDGLFAILSVAASNPSVVFIRVLALFLWLFGASVAVGLLLNVAVYLGMSLLIVRWSARHGVSPKVTAIPLFAIGYLPTWILWALQPLKDAFFCFAIVLFAFSVDRFIAAWKRPAGDRAAQIAWAVFLSLFSSYLLAGVRWYYAGLALATAGLVSLSILFVRRPPRELALRAGVILAVGLLSTQIFAVAGGPYIPKSIAATLQPWKHRGVPPAGVSGVVRVVEDSRDNLDRYRDAGTMIKSGRRIAGTSSSPAPQATPPASAPPSAATTTTVPSARPVTRTPSPAPVARETGVASTAAETGSTSAATSPSRPSSTAIKVSQRTTAPAAAAASRPAVPAVASTTSPAATTTSTFTPKPSAVAAVPAPPTPKPAVTVAPAPPPGQRDRDRARAEAFRNGRTFSEDAPKAELPQSRKDRLLTGVAALLLPRSVAVRLELVSIGGGRGLMWFAELDTILFDLVLIAVIAVVVASLHRGAWRDPFVWYLVLVTSAISGALAYTISNYGTLLRHRGMLVATAVLLAIAVRRRCASERSVAEESDVAENGAMLRAGSEMPLP